MDGTLATGSPFASSAWSPSLSAKSSHLRNINMIITDYVPAKKKRWIFRLKVSLTFVSLYALSLDSIGKLSLGDTMRWKLELCTDYKTVAPDQQLTLGNIWVLMSVVNIAASKCTETKRFLHYFSGPSKLLADPRRTANACNYIPRKISGLQQSCYLEVTGDQSGRIQIWSVRST